MDTLYRKIRIVDIIQETSDAKTFILEHSDKSPLNYNAGQFLTLIFPKFSGKEDRRSYSFSSSPDSDGRPAITLKRVTNGEYSRKLIDDAKKGDELLTIGASGYFTLPDDLNDHTHLVFLAAGSGITPIYSLLKSVFVRFPDLKVLLIYSNRSKADTIFYENLKKLEVSHPERLKIEFLFSDAADLTRAHLGKWLLEGLLKKHIPGDLHKTVFYLCGPFDYMRMATIVLQTEGAIPKNIRKENFASVKPRFILEPPDKDAHQVDIIIRDQHHSYKVQYPETILQRAKKEGLMLPYSCESGQCGTCAATCLSGKTWMWNNEVLVDSEVNKGRTLTCTAYPIEGDVVLKFD
jgi:ring-1,2-phenylacetyl-CoA epoxidase subunit PaaE